MSHDALELLREKKAREYVIKEFRQRTIVMTWEEDKSGAVTVFPLTFAINTLDVIFSYTCIVLDQVASACTSLRLMYVMFLGIRTLTGRS